MKAKIAENSRRKPAKDQKPKPEKIPVAKKKEEPDPLTSEEKKLLAQFEEDLTTVAKDAHEGFVKLVNACHQIKEKGLYRGQGTFTKYFQMKFGYSRCHANRLADAGRVLEKLSPRGDIFKKLTSESHIRPLTPLLKDEDKLQKVVDLLRGGQHTSASIGARVIPQQERE